MTLRCRLLARDVVAMRGRKLAAGEVVMAGTSAAKM
jgi:hypothetical protein